MSSCLRGPRWLRVGLFGGGFGITLDNRAEARAYVLSLDVSIFLAILEFKIDMTYRVDIPGGVLKVASQITSAATTAIAKFETLKAMALKYVYKFRDWVTGLKAQLVGFLQKLPGNLTNAITNVLPGIARNASMLISRVFGIVDDALGMEEGQRLETRALPPPAGGSAPLKFNWSHVLPLAKGQPPWEALGRAIESDKTQLFFVAVDSGGTLQRRHTCPQLVKHAMEVG